MGSSDAGIRGDALLRRLILEDGDEALAELCLRRLANRHGCTPRHCPDRQAHRRDAAALRDALMAAGLAPYQSAGALTRWGVRMSRQHANPPGAP